MNHPLPHVANTVWEARCANQTVATTPTQVICLHADDTQSRRWTCGDVPPLDVIRNHIERGVYQALVIVAPASALIPEGSHESVVHIAARQRLLLAVSVTGELVSMFAEDGQTVPSVNVSGGWGEVYADMVLAMTPHGELEAELERILTDSA